MRKFVEGDFIRATRRIDITTVNRFGKALPSYIMVGTICTVVATAPTGAQIRIIDHEFYICEPENSFELIP